MTIQKEKDRIQAVTIKYAKLVSTESLARTAKNTGYEVTTTIILVRDA
jgi:hypothetical protein